MSSRTYLSIGDVLALLRQEFPDVTISKIRFLESQGLVNPERTPSGYRKFYEHDVERLRWVLRQQREHFLPLKVIKGRLEQEVPDYGDDDGHDALQGTPTPGHAEPALVGRAGGAGSRAAGRELPGFEARASDTVRRRPEQGQGASAPGATRPELTRGGGAAAGPAPSSRTATAPGAVPAGAGPARPGAVGRGPSSGASSGSGGPAGPADPRTPSGRGPRAGAAATPEPTKVPRASMGSTDLGSRHPRSAHASAVTTAAEELTDELVVGALSGASMTIEELAQGSGVDVAAVEELESYGLVCGRVVGGVSYYDEDALTVARVAGGLARYGVEARHLRLHKHAAEREAGLIEQIVLPLLKQRNPEARLRAHEIVTELTQLGQALREVLLRTALRDQLGR